jgi:hypothetical protein
MPAALPRAANDARMLRRDGPAVNRRKRRPEKSPSADRGSSVLSPTLYYFFTSGGLERSSMNEIVIVMKTSTGLPAAVRAGS